MIKQYIYEIKHIIIIFILICLCLIISAFMSNLIVYLEPRIDTYIIEKKTINIILYLILSSIFVFSYSNNILDYKEYIKKKYIKIYIHLLIKSNNYGWWKYIVYYLI